MTKTIPLAVPKDLEDEVRQTAEQTHLSMAEVFRQATRLGLPQLRERLAVRPPMQEVDWSDLLDRPKRRSVSPAFGFSAAPISSRRFFGCDSALIRYGQLPSD